MKSFTLVVALTCFLLGACGGGGDSPGGQPINYTPQLRTFDMLDSYGVDTAFSKAPLALNPWLYQGAFEVYWSVRSREDYRVSVLINDAPEVSHSLEVYSQICGPGRWCDQTGSLICDYGADLTMRCANRSLREDIAVLFQTLPESLYLILEICDLDSPYCEFSWYPVWME